MMKLNNLTRKSSVKAIFFLLTALPVCLFLIASPTRLFAQSEAGVNHTSYVADKTMRSNARVNPSTLAMEMSIPLPSYAGRAGNTLPASLDYSSKVWGAGTPARHSTSLGMRTFISPTFAERSAAGWTSNLGVPQIDDTIEAYNQYGEPWVSNAEDTDPTVYSIYYIKRFRIIMPDGTTHEVRADDSAHSYGYSNNLGVSDTDRYSGSFLSVDGSRMRLEFNYASSVWHNILYMPDGSRYLDLPLWRNNTISGTTTYIDRSGNQMTYSFSNQKWTDTLGRDLVNPLPRNAQSSQPSESTPTFTYPGMDSYSSQAIQFKWEKLDTQQSSLSYTANAYCSGGDTTTIPSGATSLFTGGYDNLIHICGTLTTFDPVVLTEVLLPNGAKYKFHYNTYAEIDRIDYPTGGYERFAYAQTAPVDSSGGMSYDQYNRGVSDRWVSSDGTSQSEVHWQYSVQRETTSTTHGPYHVKTYAPDGTWSEQLLTDRWSAASAAYGFDDATIGRSYETRFYNNTTSNTLLRRTMTSWTSTGPVTVNSVTGYSSATRDLRPEKEISIIFESGYTSALAQMSETVYDTNDTIGSSDLQYFSSLNAKQTKVYNYKSLSLSTAQSGTFTTVAGSFSSSDIASLSETDYLYDSNYKTRGIVGLASEQRILDPANSNAVTAKKQFFYDESGYSLSSTGTMPTAASNSWIDLTSTGQLGSTLGSKRGLPTTVKSYYDLTNSLYIATHAFYDQYGNLRAARDGRGNDTTTDYSADYAFAYPTAVTTAAPGSTGTNGATAGFTTSSTYNYNTGLPLTTTDANSQTTQISYLDPATSVLDPLFRVRKITTPNGQQTLTDYGTPNSSGQYVAAQRFGHTKTQIDDSKWKEGYTWFDGLGRTIKSQSVESTGDVFVETEYDSMGRVKRSTNPYRAADTKQWTTPTYDELGRTITATSPDSQSVQIAYGLSTSAPIGTTKTITDQASRKRSGIADSLGRMVRVIEDPDSQNLATDYVFDTLGNLRKTTQGSQYRYFMYDSLGRLLYAKQPEQDANTNFSGTSYTDPVTSNNQWSVKYQYDNNGNITSTTDARNVSIAGTYDNLNRLILRDYSDSTSDVNFYYDGTGLGSVPAYSKGKTTRVSSSASETRYTSFDSLGRVLTTEQRTTDGQLAGTDAAYTFSYAYNLSGAMTDETYPSGRVVKNVLNNDGELSIVQSKKNSSQGFFNYAKSFTYNSSGAVEKMQLGNGYWETASFNNRLQVTQIGLGKLDNTQDVLKLEYGYNTTGNTDNNGSLKSQVITVPTSGTNSGFVATQNYTYDSLNRLQSSAETISSSQTWKQTFSYDRYGNRTFDTTNGNTTTLGTCSQAVCNPTVSTSSNRFSSGQDYSYDLNGNVTQDAAGKQFAYDAESRQISFGTNSSNSNGGQYVYDGEGKRVKKIVGSETTVFVYDGAGQLAAEYSTQTNTNTEVSYLTSDTVGSPRVITDQNGVVTKREDYTAFGEETITTARTNRTDYLATSSTRQDYTGYEKDGESGLEYAQARYYNSQHGRFTSVDPLTASASIKDPQTFNRYSYGLNSPYKFTDTLGLSAESSMGCSAEFDSCDGGDERTSQEAEYEQRLQNTYDTNDINRDIQNGDQTKAETICASNSDITCTRVESTEQQNEPFLTVSKKGVGTIQLRIYGPKSEGNDLEFPVNSENQQLGPSEGIDGFFWKIEISGEINGDVSEWFIGGRMTTIITSQMFSDSAPTTVKSIDQPDNPYYGIFTKQERGQGKFFTIDNPGAYSGAKFVKSYTMLQNFYTYIEKGSKRVGFKWSLYTEIRDGHLIRQSIVKYWR